MIKVIGLSLHSWEMLSLKLLGNVFTESDPIASSNIQDFISVIEPSISSKDNSKLMGDISESEVFEAVRSIGALKAPGSDGLHVILFHQFWAETKHLLIQLVKDFVVNNLPFNPINHTNIDLIPKAILSKCISPNQGAFTPGRSIFDNILIAHELFSDFKRKKVSLGAMALKLDLGKAYDLLDWNYRRALINDGHVLLVGANNIGENSINVAKSVALLDSLTAAIDRGWGQIVVEGLLQLLFDSNMCLGRQTSLRAGPWALIAS
ncbi:unnamed protein product [Prunus armeniaca]